MEHLDYLVLGGGSGGIASARRAASQGARVALIEKGRLGGTCVNVGCIPKKVMFNAAAVAEALQLAPDYGFRVAVEGFSWTELKRKRDAFIQRLNDIYRRNLQTAGVTEISGVARFIAPHVIEVGERRLTAPHVLIATGSRPNVPDLPGSEMGITSDDFFALETQPSRVVIAGSGYIAVELAGVLRALGTEVTLLCRFDRPLRHFDELLGTTLCRELRAGGMRVEMHANVIQVERARGHRLTITLGVGRQIGEIDALLWAIGRTPMIEGFGLERLGVDLTGGKIVVDEYQNTTVEGHYAVGDVTNQSCLTPVAIAAGRCLADRLFAAARNSKVDYRDIASVVFSHPPIGTVGMSEHEACERYGDHSIKVYETRFTNTFYALGEHQRPSFVKVVTRLPQETILGIHVIGLGADELIQGFAVALKLGATKADLDRTLAIHPTAAEELVTLTRSRMGRVEVISES